MDEKIALNMLKEAIIKVAPEYIYYGGTWEDYQVERCFAYELYHQWSILLDDYLEKNPNEKRLYLNGEIPKKAIGREKTYPDLVLHSGQDNNKKQIIACEIKRAEYSTSQKIIHDLFKLTQYKDLYFEGVPTSYDTTVFIMIGCDLKTMKDKITVSLNKNDYNLDVKEDKSIYEEIKIIKESSKKDTLYCMAVDKVLDDNKNEETNHYILYCEGEKLSNIVKNN